MYSSVLLLHSWLRWAVLFVGFVAVVRAIIGWNQGRSWRPADDLAARWFTISLDVQFLLGLVLYIALSPLTRVAWADFGAAMRDSVLRFWAVEHLFGMVVAMALAHVGRARIRKAPADARRHRHAAIFFGLALLIVLVSIPWPGLAHARPLFRW